MGLFDGGGIASAVGSVMAPGLPGLLGGKQMTPWGSLMGGAMFGAPGAVLGGAKDLGLMPGQAGGGGPSYGAPDASGMPGAPGYVGIANPDGTLKSPYQVTPGKLGDTSGWQKLAQQQNTTQTNQAVSDATAKGASGAESAWGKLAMGGGASSGARERLAAAGDKNAMFAGQAARSAGNNNALSIGMQGEQMNRTGDQFNITNDANAQSQNAARAAGDVSGLNQNNQFQYDQAMKNWLGQYQAGAMGSAYGNSGSSGSPWGNLLHTASFGLM